MISLKKIYGDELLRLALVLSLLKADPSDYLHQEAQQLSAGLHISNGSDWSLEHEARTLIRPMYVHPKSLDNVLMNYERQLFEELNSLGRYHDLTDRLTPEYNERISNVNSPVLHAYLLNNVATDTVAPAALVEAVVRDGSVEEDDLYDGVPDDANVGQEVKVSEEEAEIENQGSDSVNLDFREGEHDNSESLSYSEETDNSQIETAETDDNSGESEQFRPRSQNNRAETDKLWFKTEQNKDNTDSKVSNYFKTEDSKTAAPDAIITLSPEALNNRTESDIFAEIASRSFDVNEFLVTPGNMHIKKEPESTEIDLDVRVKKETQDDLYSDNAFDDFVPYFVEKSEKFDRDSSVFEQNVADLQDYDETLETLKEFKSNLDFLDVKQQQDNLDQYMLENLPLENEAPMFNPILDSEVYNLAPMFQDELVLTVKRERASTSFTSSASSSGVSEMECNSDACSEGVRVKSEIDEGQHTGDELTQEDMDLIEVLWKQDVDMGFCLDDPLPPVAPSATKVDLAEVPAPLKPDQLLQKTPDQTTLDDIEKVKQSLLEEPTKEDDPWAGLSYTVDTETGEYVLLGELPNELVGEESRFDLLEEALQLVELDEKPKDAVEPAPPVKEEEGTEMLHGGVGRPALAPPHHPAHAHHPHHLAAHYHHQSLMRQMSVERQWQDLASLLTIPPPPHDQYQPYPHPAHPHPHHNISSHPHGGAAGGYAPNYGAVAPPPPQHDKNPEHYGPPPGGASTLDPGLYKGEHIHGPHPHSHPDNIYYQQNGQTDMNGTSDGFLQSILNDEDLQLMDMAMNEGMYTMRALEGGASAVGSVHPAHPAHPHPAHTHTHTQLLLNTERDSGSDSAVSSMGSERVPSLSDGEWCDAGSDSAQDFHGSKFRPYESGFGRERVGTASGGSSQPPQKKHHMFGKRCFQEASTSNLEPLVPEARAPIVKYEFPEHTHYQHDNMAVPNVEYSRPQGALTQHLPVHAHAQASPALDLHAHALPHPHAHLQSGMASRFGPYAAPERVRHNHTYSAPLVQSEPRPPTRDKRVRRLTDGSMSDGGSSHCGDGKHLTRDEKRAKALGIPMPVHDIINLPMDEFNERLSKHDLSEAQLSLIRDIRRRGKNKVAAQNCRKRKLDQITSLADEVRTVRDRKTRLQRDHQSLQAERQRVKERFAALYRHVFQNLRDGEGRPVSSAQYSLQQAADGNVVLVPKMPHNGEHSMNRSSDDEMDRKAKNYEQ